MGRLWPSDDQERRIMKDMPLEHKLAACGWCCPHPRRSLGGAIWTSCNLEIRHFVDGNVEDFSMRHAFVIPNDV